MQKIFIHNRKGEQISVVLTEAENTTGLAFLMHGLGGHKDQPQILAVEEAFLEAGYSVVRFDTTNTFGESDGEYEKATVTNYYEDLEDVITWASGQGWYQEPFALLGHSLGGICTTLYAEKFPEKIKALAPLATVISGQLSIASREEAAEEWRKSGWREEESISRPGIIKRLPWSHMEDRLKYNILDETEKLTMPVLMVVGSKDEITPLAHQKIFYQALPGLKELHIIEGSQHTFYSEEHVTELKNMVKNWLEKIKN